MREKEADINCLTSSGIPAPMGRLKRLHKWDTSNIVADDGFREFKTTKQVDL